MPCMFQDRMSDCRSFGSNYQPCSQSRKISIGIMVDSALKAKSGATNEKEVAVANAEKVTLSKENYIEGKRESQGVRASIRGKQTEAPEQVDSPWITTRSRSPTVMTVHHAKQSLNLPANSGTQNKLNVEKDLSKVYSAQFVAKDTFILKDGDGKQKKFDRVTYKRRGGVDGISDRVKEFSFATVQEVNVSDKGAIEEDKTNKPEIKSSEVLKMKLWEILGTVSSPNKQCSNSQSLDPEGKSSELEKVCDAKGDTAVKSRQNSDTIETDSENLDHSNRRPVTRSLTRKGAPSRVQPKKIKTETSSRHKQNDPDKNIFHFQERWSGSLPAVNGGSSIYKMKNERKSSKIEPQKISFLDQYNADKIPQVANLKKIPLPAEKTSSLGSRSSGLPTVPPQVNREYGKPKTGILEKDLNEAPGARNTDKVREHDSPALSENADQHEHHGHPLFNNIVDQQDDPGSPSFGTKSPIKQKSPSSAPKIDQMDLGCGSPASANKIFTVGNICSFKTWQTSKPDIYASDAQTESSVSLITCMVMILVVGYMYWFPK